MIKFFTFLIAFNFFNFQAQAQSSIADFQKLIQSQIKNIDLESLGLDNIEKKPMPEVKNNENDSKAISSNVINNITEVEEKKIQDLTNNKKDRKSVV